MSIIHVINHFPSLLRLRTFGGSASARTLGVASKTGTFFVPGIPKAFRPQCTVTAVALLSLFLPTVCMAQQPRINTLFPIGGRAGETVEVEIRGAGLAGADKMLAHGAGVSGTVDPGGVKVDDSFKAVWQGKCAGCHELRSPSNRSMTPAQWAATVDRMVRVRQAPLSPDETNKVTQYLTGLARAGKVTAHVHIAPDAQPGLYEMRVVTPGGVSTVGLFEVGRLPEVLAVNNKREQALPVTLPCVANGSMVANGERHHFKFAAKKGQRYVFNMKAFRYNEQTQDYFNPDLRLYDAAGKQIAENHGYYDLDPLIDWTCDQDGDYTLEARDLLGRGNPGDVYRLAMGSVPYDTAVYPPIAPLNAHVTAALVGQNVKGADASFTFDTPAAPGITTVSSPVGPQPLYVTPYPIARAESKSASAVTLPAAFTGRVSGTTEANTFAVQGTGRFEFNVYSRSVASPLAVRIALLNDKGKAVANMNRTGRLDNVGRPEPDGRLTADLQPGQTYTLRVQAAPIRMEDSEANKPDATAIYCVEARSGVVLDCVARSANVTLRPGLSTMVEVVLARRDGITGDITLTAQNLPPGVTAMPAVIQPDRQRGFVILKADQNAVPSERPIEIMASGKGPNGTVQARAVPQEMYRMNNNPYYLTRMECMAAVRGRADFTASLVDEGPIRVYTRKGVVVRVHITRRDGFKGNVTVQMDGLPLGWVANQETAGPDQNEVKMTVRPDGNNPQPFLKRDPAWTPIHAVVVAGADEFEYAFATPLVVKADRAEEEDKPAGAR